MTTAACDIRDHHARCVPYLARLQMLASDKTGEPLPPGLPEEVGRATSAVLAEAEAAGRVTVAAVAGGRRRSAMSGFLAGRQGIQ